MTTTTPMMMKTPTMESLTQKYEFLLDHEKKQPNFTTQEAADDEIMENFEASTEDNVSAYFQTHPTTAQPSSFSSSKHQHQSTGVEQTLSNESSSSISISISSSNRPNVQHRRSFTSSPLRRSTVSAVSSIPESPVSAQRILDRLDSVSKCSPVTVPAAESTFDDVASIGSNASGRRYRNQLLKQNLEQRLQQMEEDDYHPTAAMTPPTVRSYPHHGGGGGGGRTTNTSTTKTKTQQYSPPRPNNAKHRNNSNNSSSGTRRQSPFYKAFSGMNQQQKQQHKNKSLPSPIISSTCTPSNTRSLPTTAAAAAASTRKPVVVSDSKAVRDDGTSFPQVKQYALEPHHPQLASTTTNSNNNSSSSSSGSSSSSSSSSKHPNVLSTDAISSPKKEAVSFVRSSTYSSPLSTVSQLDNNRTAVSKNVKCPSSSQQQQQQQQLEPQQQQQRQQQQQQYEEDTASFWHRWKMAETRLQQQQEQFEKEKRDWISQLDSAHQANAQVEALAKRMELQLVAVHKTCLQQGDDDDDDDDDDTDTDFDDEKKVSGILDMDSPRDKNVHSGKEVPIDPLHLLMLKDSGVAADSDLKAMEKSTNSDEWDDNNNGNLRGDMDSFEYTEKLERRMARTRTKNVILSHLVKLLEKQAEENTKHLQERLQNEKEERRELGEELAKSERQFEQQQQQHGPGQSSEAIVIQSKEYKALENRLWMREQEYEQERKEYEANVEKLQLENKRLEARKAEQYLVTAKLVGLSAAEKNDSTPIEDGDQNMAALQSRLNSLLEENKASKAKCQSLQQQLENVEKRLAVNSESHTKALREQQEEHQQTKEHLEAVMEDAEELAEQATALRTQMERMENKHNRERKQWEWSLLQQGKRSDTVSVHGTGNNTNTRSSTEQLEHQLKVAEAEINRLENELQASTESQRANALNKDKALKTVKADVQRLERELQTAQEELQTASEGETVARELLICQHALQEETAKCTAVMARHETLQVEMDLLDRRREEEMADMNSLVETLQQEKGKHSETKMQLQQLSVENEGLESTLREVNADLQATMKALEAEASNCRDAIEAKSALEKGLQEIDVEFSKERAELDSQQEKLKIESQRVQQELEAKVARLESELKRKDSLCKDLQNEHANLDVKMQQLSLRFVEEMEVMKQRYLSLQSQSTKNQQTLDQKHCDFESTISNLQAELSKAKTAKTPSSHADDELTQLKMANTAFQSRVEDLQTDANGANTKLKEESLRRASLEGEVQQLLKKLDVVTAELEAEKAGSVYLKGEVQHLQNEMNAATAKEEEGKKTISFLQDNIRSLQEEHDSTKFAVEEGKAKIKCLQDEIQNISNAFDDERDNWETQKHQLVACESTDTVRTQELIEKNAERERQLNEAKKDLEVGLAKLQAEEEKYRFVVEKNSSLHDEVERLRQEKVKWENMMQSLKDDGDRDLKKAAAETSDLYTEMQRLEYIHQKALEDWRLSSEENNNEVNRLQQQIHSLAHEKSVLQSNLAAAERQIQVTQEHYEASKIEWNERSRHSIPESYGQVMSDLRLEVLKIGEQLTVSNETIKELAEKRENREAYFDNIQLVVEETAAKVAEESRVVGLSHEAVVRRLNELGQTLGASSSHHDGANTLSEFNILLERLRDICLQQETRAHEEKVVEGLQSELACLKQELTHSAVALQRVKRDLQMETKKRENAEKKFFELKNFSTDLKKGPQPLVANDGHESAFSEDRDLDMLLKDLEEQIEFEIQEVREIGARGKNTSAAVDIENCGALSSARQAMTAQTLLLVQSMRDLLHHDGRGDDDEEPPTAVLHHLEILSELMGEVDVLESQGAVVMASTSSVAIDALHAQPESAIVPFNSVFQKEAGAESDLLRYELAQDDTMLDLLDDDVLYLQGQKGALVEQPQSDIVANKVASTGSLEIVASTSPDEMPRASSPIELVVQQTYNRCQVLERERCDLINVTLDLLSSAREANKAEIDAALASARRKASEEMIAMQKECRAQADQIWWRLCDKCRSSLSQRS